MPKHAPSSHESPPRGPRHVQVCQEEAGKEKINVSGEIQLVFRFSLGVLAVLDQSGLLGSVCTWLGCPRVSLGQTTV